MKCVKCGITELGTADINAICFQCALSAQQINPHPTILYNSGWVCPKCGTVYAPHVQGCVKCNNPMEITY